MVITDLISITELSRITNKSRPTLYKYIKDYSQNRFDDIPYSFIVLFERVDSGCISKSEIIEYCRRTYASATQDEELSDLVNLITDNRSLLNLSEIKAFVEEILKNERSY